MVNITQAGKAQSWTVALLSRDRINQLIQFSFLTFLFFMPFPHTPTIRAIALGLAIVGWILNMALFEGFRLEKNPLTLWISIYFLIAVASALFSIEPWQSLKALKGDLLVFVLTYLLIIGNFKTFKDNKRILLCFVISSSLLSLVSLGGFLYYGMTFFEIHHLWISRVDLAFHLVFYIPIVLGTFFLEKGLITRLLLTVVIPLQFLLVYLGDRRTALIAALLGAIFLLWGLRRYLIIAGFIGVFVLSILFFPGRYASIFYLRTFTADKISGRYEIWMGTYELIKERPLLGHGYGWRKFQAVIEENYVHGKKEEDAEIKVFLRDKGARTNAHNLLLQITFETGILGLAAFLLLWVQVIRVLFNGLKNIYEVNADWKDHRAFLFTILSTFISYHALSSMFSLGSGVSGVLIWASMGLAVSGSRRGSEHGLDKG